MKRMSVMLSSVTLVVAAWSMSGCEEREIVTPTDGSVRVETINHPVSVRTKDAEGAGWIKALNFETDVWDVIHINPAGDVAFNEPIAEEYWQCARRRGCVAALQVGDERGVFPTGKEDRRLYVCTEGYVQNSDRRHCDLRTIERQSIIEAGPDDPPGPVYLGPWNEYEFQSSRSHPVFGGDMYRYWNGDTSQRLFTGSHDFINTNNAWDPPLPGDYSGGWQEFEYEPDKFGSTTFASGDLYSADLGVCRVFIPWKWEDRIQGSGYNDAIGGYTDNLGIGELLVEGMIDTPISNTVYTEDAKRWMDTLTNVWSRTDVSPEFHFRVKNGQSRQICMVQYVAANNRLKTKPDSGFWVWGQGIAAFFLELFRIADCPTKPIRIQYCGGLNYTRASGGEPAKASFKIDPSSVQATMYNYPRRPACRNQFKPKIENEFPAKIVGPVEAALTANLTEMASLFPALLGGAQIRRFEPTPSGLYLITAESAADPQYGKGECDQTLEGPKQSPAGLKQGDWASGAVPATGITRPMQ